MAVSIKAQSPGKKGLAQSLAHNKHILISLSSLTTKRHLEKNGEGDEGIHVGSALDQWMSRICDQSSQALTQWWSAGFPVVESQLKRVY